VLGLGYWLTASQLLGKDFFLFIVFFFRTGSVRFGFTSLNSTKLNRTGSFSKNSNRFNQFFSWFGFFD
jgi:hypothetical protein